MTTTIAYLDPGSAGVIVQMIGGGAVALGVAVKMFGRRILQKFHIGRHGSGNDAPPAEQP